MDMPILDVRSFTKTQDDHFETNVPRLAKESMKDSTPEVAEVIACDSAYSSRRNASSCAHVVLNMEKEEKPKVIGLGVVSRIYSRDLPPKDQNGNFPETQVGQQNFFGTSQAMVKPAVTKGIFKLI